MILINTISEKYFELNGVQYPKIYQPLKQGSKAIGIYCIYDNKLQLQSSEDFDQYKINGFVYPSQETTIAAILNLCLDVLSIGDIEDVETRVSALEVSQTSNLIVFQTYALMIAADPTGVAGYGYKVINDADTAKNGQYSSDGVSYTLGNKDTVSVLDDTDENDFVNGKAVGDYHKSYLVIGKNKFNLDDPTNIRGSYLQSSDGAEVVYVNNTITHYIPILAGQTMYCNTASVGSGVCHVLYDSTKTLLSIVSTVKEVTAAADGFVRFTLAVTETGSLSATQVELGSVETSYSAYALIINKDDIVYLNDEAISENIARAVKTTILTVKRLGTSGIDADFCGLNAIGDALASITDASEINRYKILVEGYFLFTLQTEFDYEEPQFGEPTVIIGKNWVDIEGLGKERTVIAVELDSGQIFTDGKVYTDFQPVMWNCNGTLSNLALIGKNCRYTIHIESGILANDAEMNFEHLYIAFKGSQEMGGGAGNAIGTGMREGQIWNFNQCEVVCYGGAAFGVHTALDVLEKGGEINMINCSLIGDNIFFDCYPNDKILNVNLIDCSYSPDLKINYRFKYDNGSVLSDYSDIKIRSNTEPLLFSNLLANKGTGLKITSKTTGASSGVVYDETSTAFGLIIGNSNEEIAVENGQLITTEFGCQKKSGAVGFSAYSIGGIDIDEANTSKTNGLGVLLGDCSIVNKTLSVLIDAVNYDIIFNEDFTFQNNAYVIAKITAVVGAVATVEEFYSGREYYPLFNNMSRMINKDTSTILKGSGVVYISQTEMRKAQNSDNRIDGICLYDTEIDAKGKVIEKGSIFSLNSGYRFATLETLNTLRAVGDELGIAADGVFDISATPKLLCAVGENILKIL